MSVRARAVRWGSTDSRAESARGRVLLFVHYGGEGIRGSERCLLDLMAGLDRSQFVPLLWCNARTLASEAHRLGIRAILGTGWDERSGSLLPARSLLSEARELLRTHNVALIHANSAIPVKWLLPAARTVRIPIVAHLHILLPRESRLYLFLHQVSHVVGVSETAAEGVRQDGVVADAVSVIYNGVDPGLADGPIDTQWRRRLGLAPATRTLITVGALVQAKGVDTLVRALARLRALDHDVALVVVGDGPERVPLSELAAQLDVADRVHFTGHQRDVGLALRTLGDIFVSGSRGEAFPLSLLEAGACRLPVVVSDIAAHREAVVVDVTGGLAAVDDDAAFATAIVPLLRDDAARRQMGEAGLARVLSQFTQERYVHEFQELYTRLLHRPRRAYGWWRSSRWPSAYGEWFRQAVSRRLARQPESVSAM